MCAGRDARAVRARAVRPLRGPDEPGGAHVRHGGSESVLYAPGADLTSGDKTGCDGDARGGRAPAVALAFALARPRVTAIEARVARYALHGAAPRRVPSIRLPGRLPELPQRVAVRVVDAEVAVSSLPGAGPIWDRYPGREHGAEPAAVE